MFRFYVLGRVTLLAPDGSEVPGAVAGDLRILLLAYLALGMPGFCRRDTIMGTLWPEADASEARHRLRQLLYLLRHELGDDVLLTDGRGQVGLDPATFWCDAVAFRRAVAEGMLEGAQELYGGSLCEGVVVASGVKLERWLDRERERLEEQAVDSAWLLAMRSEEEGRLSAALAWGERALDLAPDEDRLRWLLALSARCGDHIVAIRFFERFERRIAEEYGLTPSAETMELVEALRDAAAAEAREERSRQWPTVIGRQSGRPHPGSIDD